jgi:hypothetical protein
MQRYADEVKRVRREKLGQEGGETVGSFSANRVLINY